MVARRDSAVGEQDPDGAKKTTKAAGGGPAKRSAGAAGKAAGVAASEMAGTEMYGSDLAAVVGSHSLRGVTIDAGQVLSLALAMFPGLGITVGDRSTPD